MEAISSIKKTNEPVDVFINETQPVKKKLSNYGYIEAGRNGGDSAALSSYLEQIRDGYIVSEAHNEAKQQVEQEKIEREIYEVEQEVRTAEMKIKDIEENKISDHKIKIQEAKDEIEKLENKKSDDLEKDTTANFNFWMYLLVFVPLTFFLYTFYVSSFHNAFFRNIAKQVATANASNISSVLNTVFNGSAFTEFHLHWFAPVIFFAFAMVLHRFYDAKTKYRFIGVTAIVLFIFFADGLLAYFIEYNNHKLEILMGMEKGNWVFYKSPVFIMVLVMGFFTCMGWSILLYTLREEKEKVNPKFVIQKKIALLKTKITEIEAQILILKSEVSKCEAEVENLKKKIELLKKELENIHYRVNELKLNINEFYSGWLKYIVNLNHSDKLKSECESIKDKFISAITANLAA